MLGYNFQLALRSIKQRSYLTILMVLAIGIGIGLLITVQTMAYHNQKMPLAHKANDIYFIQADNRDLGADPIVRQPYMIYLTHRDATNLIQGNSPASAHTTVWKSDIILNSFSQEVRPFRSATTVTNSSFFSMFDVPFLYGAPWDKDSDTTAAPVIVLTKESNELLFGGENSVGKQLRINEHTVTVVGVLDNWDLKRRFYDESYSTSRKDTAFIPDSFAVKNNIMRNERIYCLPQDRNKRGFWRTNDIQGLINSECSFVRLWAQIDDESKASDYEQYLTDYVNSQKELGRFPREMNNYVTSLFTMVTLANELRSGNDPLSFIAPLFFAVCLLNAIGILLAKFMRKTGEVSLRRALGANKITLMNQYLLEVILIGVMGGIVGCIFAYLGLQGMMRVNVYQSDYSVTIENLRHAFALDLWMVGKAFAIAVVSTIIVGLYPIWRIVNVAPASQLKSQ